MATIIKRIKNVLGDIIHPITSTRAVYDDDGVPLNTTLEKGKLKSITFTPIANTTLVDYQCFLVDDIATFAGEIRSTTTEFFKNNSWFNLGTFSCIPYNVDAGSLATARVSATVELGSIPAMARVTSAGVLQGYFYWASERYVGSFEVNISFRILTPETQIEEPIPEMTNVLPYKKLLWTNPDPTASIIDGTVIPINLINYNEIEVVYNDRDNQITRGSFIGQVGYSLTLNRTSGSVCQYRTIAISTTGITCNSCSTINFATMTTTTTDKYMVPVKIYGIRKVE